MNNQKYSHRELIGGLIAGNILPRTPIAFWRHFPLDDQDPQRLAQATFQFQDTYDFDLIKVSPSSSFCIRDWGISDRWNGNTEGTRDYLNALSLEEAQSINVLDPQSGSLGAQLKSLAAIADKYLQDTPVIQTIFSPLSQLKNILGKENFLHAIRHHPNTVKKILERICLTTSKFMKVCQELKIDGFFLAVQHAASEALAKDEFIEFGKAYDERLFDNLKKAKTNMLHIHGNNIYFDLMLDYPCQILNWHDRETSPSLSQAITQTDKVVCGGLSRIETMVRGDRKLVEGEIMDAVSHVEGRNLLLGTGCVLPIITPHGNIKLAVDIVRQR